MPAVFKVMNTSTTNGSKNCHTSVSQVQQFIESRRQIIEQSRSANLKRIQQDIQKIAKREREFSKKMFEELVPVKVIWNDEAWKKLQDFIPVRFETKEETVETVNPEVVDEESSTSNTV